MSTLKSLYKSAVRSLDRDGLRWVLRLSVNMIARMRGSQNRIAFKDGFWSHRVKNLLVVDGMRFWYPRTITSRSDKEYLKYTETAKDYWFYMYSPASGDVIVDIGAGKGEDIFSFSNAVGDQGRVIAVEALPSTFACLAYFVKENDLHNVEPLQVAISESNSEVMMTDDDVSWLSNSLEGGAVEVAKSEIVKTITLDDLVQEKDIKKISFLKMNIEGAERLALKGMKRSLGIIENICISCHDFRTERGESEYFRTLREVEDTLKAAGFQLKSRAADHRPYIACQVNGTRAVS